MLSPPPRTTTATSMQCSWRHGDNRIEQRRQVPPFVVVGRAAHVTVGVGSGGRGVVGAVIAILAPRNSRASADTRNARNDGATGSSSSGGGGGSGADLQRPSSATLTTCVHS